jgi:hypothetical protein
MAYWMIACSVYLYIATLGVNVRICREAVRLDDRGHDVGSAYDAPLLELLTELPVGIPVVM